ncbi:hypothetical protein COU62_00870 [Candidatus Pacearchaeota archaeon CG10_big_fil_rev_8_21_14_0_10_35_219]|nr:hypothetical protein [Candidatus Pacearchaeota archaeon]OIO42769.1 MAG: hypothetical protein AUJ63_02005 [Candidatus Pacearchaeota archaeon CG1_02_35_32]PIO08238.1 MAG: hypothetical protein COU62_00870 [Candidatus Pacearchaeota archaeon CG10_big_fil_rev_8_21_14_0_10_35_219]PIY81747.1 MAG: hypothetical protein COY79_01170 [Candidatus Pacearchaeota archaeon CG_4_10_14_0_8_um_filter_35_169]PIZ80348.1 MAG: hypothetical protein COY00_01330 [Candidatus Pacearchaeota archaeon CG_4_10_14_0_2_um_filt
MVDASLSFDEACDRAYSFLNSYYQRDMGEDLPRSFFDETILPRLQGKGIKYRAIIRLARYKNSREAREASRELRLIR